MKVFRYGDGRGEEQGLVDVSCWALDGVTDLAEGELSGDGQGLVDWGTENTLGDWSGDGLGLTDCGGRGVVEREDTGEL